jgi:hypothetical protein
LDNITIVVPDRTDEEGGPKFAAILAAVKDLAVGVGIVFELLADGLVTLTFRSLNSAKQPFVPLNIPNHHPIPPT